MIKDKVVDGQLLPLGEDELKELKAQGARKTFAKGDFLWQEGDDPEAVWIVEEGRANMVIDGCDGSQSLVNFCTKAQTFCAAAAISGKHYPCSAMAATELTAVAVPRSRFMALFNRLPQLARGLITQMVPQICESHVQQARNVNPVKARLAGLLSQLNRRFQGRDLLFTRQELANMSGTTVESCIRALSDWEKRGVIHSERGRIRVRRAGELEEAAA